MPGSLTSRVNAAWNAIWSDADAHAMPRALKSGSRVGHTWFRPMRPLRPRATGPVVLLNQEPWGSVDLNLHENEVTQLETISGDDFKFDEATGQFTATVHFRELRFAGKYTVRRGEASGSAMKTAMAALGAPAPGASLGAPPPGDPQNIAIAKNYQKQLTTSDSGRYMLSAYYLHNDAYAQIYDNRMFALQWKMHQTNGKTTATFAAQTASAAQNPAGPQVNGDPDYNSHSIAMNLLVVATCNAQGNTDAATAASTFQNTTQPDAQPAQTVNQVMNTVSTTPPPAPTTMLRSSALMSAPAMPEMTPKVAAIHEQLKDVISQIQKEEDDVRAGLILRENTSRPIDGEFRAYFATQPMTLTGTIKDDPTGPVVQFASLEGTPPEVRVQLGAFPGNLHAEVDRALDRAAFLKGLLGTRIMEVLNDPQFLGYLARIMASAIRTARSA